jgi:hypothetical protein
MSAAEWIYRCSARLHRQWPGLSVVDMDETARELWQQERYRSLPPGDAAVEWLRQGVLAE